MCWHREEPFKGRGVHQIFSRVCNGKRPAVSKKGDKAAKYKGALTKGPPPKPLKELIERCWAQSPAERPTAESAFETFVQECLPALGLGGGMMGMGSLGIGGIGNVGDLLGSVGVGAGGVGADPAAEAEALALAAADAATATLTKLQRGTTSAFSFAQAADPLSTLSRVSQDTLQFAGTIAEEAQGRSAAGGGKGEGQIGKIGKIERLPEGGGIAVAAAAGGGRRSTTTKMSVEEFLGKGGLEAFAAPLEALGYDDVAALSDRELLTDAILTDATHMTRAQVLRFRSLVEEQGTSPSLTHHNVGTTL